MNNDCNHSHFQISVGNSDSQIPAIFTWITWGHVWAGRQWRSMPFLDVQVQSALTSLDTRGRSRRKKITRTGKSQPFINCTESIIQMAPRYIKLLNCSRADWNQEICMPHLHQSTVFPEIAHKNFVQHPFPSINFTLMSCCVLTSVLMWKSGGVEFNSW